MWLINLPKPHLPATPKENSGETLHSVRYSRTHVRTYLPSDSICERIVELETPRRAVQ